MLKITTHTIVKNEENWIWYSLMSIKEYVSEMLVLDDGSTDKTLEIVKSIKDPKIKIFSEQLDTPADHTRARNEMIDRTKTDWFLILDGDEVWNASVFLKLLNFLEKCPKDIYGVVMRNRNCVGDVFHYQDECYGKYQFLGRKGNLTIRAYRKMPGFFWKGDYPLESYADINSEDTHLAFFDNYYWHMTFLPRSSVDSVRKHKQLVKYDLGIKAKDNELPEIFKGKVLPKRNAIYLLIAGFMSPMRWIKQKF